MGSLFPGWSPKGGRNRSKAAGRKKAAAGETAQARLLSPLAARTDGTAAAAERWNRRWFRYLDLRSHCLQSQDGCRPGDAAGGRRSRAASRPTAWRRASGPWGRRRSRATRPRRSARPTASTRSCSARVSGHRRRPDDRHHRRLRRSRTWSTAPSPNFDTSDLHKFDEQFGLPDPPSFLKLNETGGTTLPAASGSSGWSVEESLDVEWAHAIAPQANIILFEANSPSDADLITTAVEHGAELAGRDGRHDELRPQRIEQRRLGRIRLHDARRPSGRDVPGIDRRQRRPGRISRPIRPTWWPWAARP